VPASPRADPRYRFCTASLVTSYSGPRSWRIWGWPPTVWRSFRATRRSWHCSRTGRSLAAERGPGDCAAEIAKFSPHDAKAYSEYGDTMRRLARFIEPYMIGPVPDAAVRRHPALKATMAAAIGLPDSDLGRS